MPLITSLHFTPDGVSGPRHVLTINIALLTDGGPQTKSILLLAAAIVAVIET